jgi:hypothetical protein
MAARHGAGSRFEIATAQAARFLDESRPSAANIVWIDAGPTAAFPEPGPNLAFLTDSLKQAAPRPEPGALAAAFDLALRQLAQVQGHRELVVFSDFQASAWKDFAPALPAGLEIRAFQTAAAPPPNLAVSRLLTQPPQPVAGQETTVLASVRNFSADPVRSQLTLDAGGSRQSRAIEIPAWGETETAFTIRPASAGPVPVTASVEADTFPGDDARHAVLRVRDAIRIDDSQAPNAVLEKVVAALPWLEKSTAAPGLYRWEVSGQTIDLAAVNFPDSESDLRPLPAAPTFGNRAADAGSPATAAAFARGIELWPWLALAAVLFLLAESLLVLRSSRPATSAGVRPTNG